MHRLLALYWAVAVSAIGCGSKKNPFAPVPECMGATVVPFQGSRQIVVASLAIADTDEGFDLDGDGKVDNKLAPLGSLANDQIKLSFSGTTAKHDIVLPIELFGYMGSDVSCAKFTYYVGKFNKDRDADGKDTTWDHGDCEDTDPNIKPGATEIIGNHVDDDCDGFADNMTPGSPPNDNSDLDGDGVTLAQGDCDDRNDSMHIAEAKSRHPGAMDICNNGIDENCDGIPDNDPSCDPFAMNDATVDIQSVSFADGMTAMQPLISFKDGSVKKGVLVAGPDAFNLNVPFQKGIAINLQLNGAHVQMDLVDAGGLTNVPLTGPDGKAGGRLGGVLEAITLAQIKGINAGGVIKPDQSLLDATFVGAVGTVLGLDQDKDQHYLPDIDVDGDGLETFWQTNPPAAGASPHVDTCKDGDGTIIMGTDCPLAKDAKGNYRFVDGLSVALKFTAVPVKLGSVIP